LFDEKDGVYATLEKIKDCNAKISADEKQRANKDESGGTTAGSNEYAILLMNQRRMPALPLRSWF